MPHSSTTAVGQFSCLGCGHVRDRVLYVGTDYLSQRRFPVLACAGCGLIQTAEDGTGDAPHPYDEYYGKRQSIFEPITNRLRRRRLLKNLREKSPGAILDVGCGRGGFLVAMRGAGWRVAGVERPVSAYQALWRAERLDVSTDDWERSEYPDASFDVVTFWHVFEHLPSPHQALERASRTLRSDGTLVIAVPNIAGVQARLFKTRWFHLDVPRHLVHYSIGSLRMLLKQHAFVVTSVNHYSFEYDTFGAIQSALNACCRTQNLLFDLLMHRRSVGSIVTRADPRELADLVLTAWLTIPLALVAVPFCWVTSWAGQGATIEVYAKKSDSEPNAMAKASGPFDTPDGFDTT